MLPNLRGHRPSGIKKSKRSRPAGGGASARMGALVTGAGDPRAGTRKEKAVTRRPLAATACLRLVVAVAASAASDCPASFRQPITKGGVQSVQLGRTGHRGRQGMFHRNSTNQHLAKPKPATGGNPRYHHLSLSRQCHEQRAQRRQLLVAIVTPRVITRHTRYAR